MLVSLLLPALGGHARATGVRRGASMLYDFNNVDVSAAKDPAHKLFFSLTVDGVETHTNVWLHGVDGRTIFPVWDVVQ